MTMYTVVNIIMPFARYRLMIIATNWLSLKFFTKNLEIQNLSKKPL